ncbi:ribokinase [Algoriphagus namhaensis]|uniref:Ribokinase n=1 Tax=Algoriphagus namhaensis TaxID=915353 RepID=A0ABV8ANA8_9BACT
MGKILVVGSSNTDMVIKAPELPRPGETVLGGEFFSFAGGKGANQAVAAAKLGGDVIFLAKVGDDELGKNAIQSFQKLGIDTSLIRSAKGLHSGVALILIDGNGENSISVASGANNSFTLADIDSIDEVLGQTEFVLVQLEIPIPMVEYLVEKCSEKGVKVILNPAPAAKLSLSCLAALNIITPNETEAEMLTGVKVSDEKSAEKAAHVLLESGVENVIITLGAKGSFFLNRVEKGLVPAFSVQALDTTAAGDTFNGALAVALAEGQSLKDSILFANRAASISVTRMGAQDSQPFRHEIIL